MVDKRGTKREDPDTGKKFYDLNKRPAHCPKCETEFDPEEAVKSRRGRSRVANYEDDEAPPAAEAEVEGFEDEVDETPEIDQAIEDEVVEPDEEGITDPAETAPKPAADGDLGVDFATEEDLEAADDEDDVPFLEDDDEDFDEDAIDGLPGEDDRD